MYCLTEQQIDYILNDIRARGVKMEELQQNLLDHVCCIIEQNLEVNGDFEHFYATAIKTFYKKELREIEEETILLLTFKNYYKMKKAMIISGTFSAATFIIGSFFKVMHWPGAAVLLFSGIVTFCFLFLPLMLTLKMKETNKLREKLVLTTGTIIGILYCMSALFLVQHWPGARIMWFSTLILTFFGFIPLYFFTGIRHAETKVNTIVTTLILVAFTGVEFTITAIRPKTNGKVYTYIQNEQLLKKIQQRGLTDTSKNNDQLIAEIQNTCEEMKGMILMQDIGMKYIPEDFEAKDIFIRERNILKDLNTGEEQKILSELRAKVNEYNESTTLENKIPTDHTILNSDFVRREFCTNLFALNNINQLQLYLAAAK
jgi:hypothetical protein